MIIICILSKMNATHFDWWFALTFAIGVRTDKTFCFLLSCIPFIFLYNNFLVRFYQSLNFLLVKIEIAEYRCVFLESAFRNRKTAFGCTARKQPAQKQIQHIYLDYNYIHYEVREVHGIHTHPCTQCRIECWLEFIFKRNNIQKNAHTNSPTV